MPKESIHAENPACVIGAIPLISTDEQTALMERWQGKAADYPRDETLATLFAARVAAMPAATAIVDGDRTLTFAELDAQANAIAARLNLRGVKPGDRVGISIERSATAIAGMLAVMRLGAACVALDPDNPAERLIWIAEDAGLICIVTRKAIAVRLGFADQLTLDDLTAREIAQAPPTPPIDTDPGSIAYMVYTSGSTGTPKGVAMPHRPTVNRFAWMWREFPFENGEVMCQKTALSFVDSVWEIFGPLLAGVPLVIIGNDTLLEPRAFLGALDRHGVTRLLVVPSLLKTVVESDIELMSAAPRLKLLFTSGDRIPAKLARSIRERAPHITLINLYGSSEVAADVTCEVVDRVETDDVPIGRPIDNTRLYVLDATRRPVPPGQVGELHVGGEVLAAGYHGRPDLTAERFLPDPFSDADGARMFATGDLVHHLPDGRLVFRGRSDHQVKIRGSRVELGEVEAALAAQPGVAEAIAVAQADNDGEKMLAAFVTTKGAARMSESALRDALARSLPVYMVPAQIRVLDRMPLNPNGKIDRPKLSDMLIQALAAPDPMPTPTPTTRTESEILEIWKSILRRRDIRPDDDFFKLGGYSLLAVKLFTRIRRRFGIDMPIATLLDAPTVRSLARRVEERLKRSVPIESAYSGTPEDSPWDTTAVIHPGPGNGDIPLFIAGGVGGNVNNLYELGQFIGRHRPLIGFQTRGILGHRMHDTIEAAAADHIANMRRRQPMGPYFLAGYSGGALAAYEMARQLQHVGETVAFLGLIDAAAPKFRVDISFTLRDRLAHKALMLRQHGFSQVLTSASLWIRGKCQPELIVRIGEKLWPEKFRYERIVKHWWRISPAYNPGPYDGNAWLYLTNAETDGYVASKMREADPLYGWPALIRGELTVSEHEADHLGLMSGDDVTELADLMEAEIARIHRQAG